MSELFCHLVSTQCKRTCPLRFPDLPPLSTLPETVVVCKDVVAFKLQIEGTCTRRYHSGFELQLQHARRALTANLDISVVI